MTVLRRQEERAAPGLWVSDYSSPATGHNTLHNERLASAKVHMGGMGSLGAEAVGSEHTGVSPRAEQSVSNPQRASYRDGTQGREPGFLEL